MYKLKLGGIYIEVTSVCNRKCPYCYNDSTLEGIQLEKDAIFRLFRDCKQAGIVSVSISGGEPFLHSNIFEILEMLEELHMRAAIITNLSFLPIEKAVEIAKHGHSLQITFDSTEQGENDKSRGNGSFELNKTLLNKFKQEGLLNQVVLRYNVNKSNSDKIENIISLAIDYGVKSLDLALLFKSGRGCSYEYVFDYKKDLLEIAKLMSYLKVLKEKNQDKVDIVYSNLNDQMGCVLFADGELSIGPKVEPNGDVYICQLFSGKENILGNIYESSIEEILDSERARNLVDKIRKRKEIQKGCSSCAFTDLCMCGCPAVSYNQTGSLLDKDDQCSMIKFFLKERVKQIGLQ